MKKILATPRSFGKEERSPIILLEDAGFQVFTNPVGSILTEDQMCEHIGDAVGVIVGVDPINKKVLDSAKNLKVISKYGVGTDNIDLVEAEKRGIVVKVTLGANASAVADYAFALMAACARRLVEIDDACHKKDWSKKISVDIYGKRIGIIGLGSIGKGLAERCEGFGMEIWGYDSFWDNEYAEKNKIIYKTPEEMYSAVDFLSVHLPLNDDTRNLIGEKEFKLMRPTAVVINTARGGIINEDALINALKNKQIYAAGIDAFEREPPEREDIYQIKNLIMGSHCGASTFGATEKMGMMAAQNIIDTLINDKPFS